MSITTRPRVLPDDLAALKAAGIQTLVSLQEPQEAAAVGLETQAQTCADIGIDFLNHPIRDMHLPDAAQFRSFAAALAARLQASDKIAIHCHASIGRSGMLACAVLGHFGYTSATALTHVSKKRGTHVPDTPQQTAFIHKIMEKQA
ncbi:hypothetical protein ABMC88_03155 [Sulfitobacter sp. HNIBRBA2951]|uniref:protein-tyrosine phosphatase family protein n=1 Tax=Sulfitobacter aquimarinus TaxID=3158557 RepID=UPI0032DE8018